MSESASQKKTDSSGQGRSVARAAGLMGIATLMSRVLGLVREQVFAFLFGAGAQTDAFQIAFRIPNLLRDLFAEGALSSALVPTYTEEREKKGARRGWRVAALVFIALFTIVSLIALVGSFFADSLVATYAPKFIDNPMKYFLTVRMTRTMFPFFPLVALAAAFMAILNACGYFFLPAFSSALFNLASIITGVICSEVIRRSHLAFRFDPIEGMAVGVVIGGMAQAFCQWPALKRAGFQWVKKEESDPPFYKDPALRRMLFLMVPGTFGLAATQINILVNSMLATSQGDGAVSWLNYAFRLMQFPIGVFGVSLATATLARVSAQKAKGEFHELSETVTSSLKKVFALNLPASSGLAFLSVPIIALIFQYGRFHATDTLSTAKALAAYSIGLTAYSAVKVLVPVFYALGNTSIPVISSVMTVGLNLLINVWLVRRAGFVGLAFGTSMMAILNAVFLLLALRIELKRHSVVFSVGTVAKSAMQHAAIALIMGGAAYAALPMISGLTESFPAMISRSVTLVVLMGLALVVWVALLRLFRISEARVIFEFVKRFKLR